MDQKENNLADRSVLARGIDRRNTHHHRACPSRTTCQVGCYTMLQKRPRPLQIAQQTQPVILYLSCLQYVMVNPERDS